MQRTRVPYSINKTAAAAVAAAATAAPVVAAACAAPVVAAAPAAVVVAAAAAPISVAVFVCFSIIQTSRKPSTP